MAAHRTTLLPAVGILAAVLTLAGCTSEPPGQSAAQACTIASEGLRPVGNQMSTAMSKLSLGDVDAARIVVNDLDRQLDAITAKLSHERVAGQFAAIRSTVSKIVPVFNDLSAKDALRDTATAAAASAQLAQISAQLQSDATSLNEICDAN